MTDKPKAKTTLAGILPELQAAIVPPPLDGKNPHFKSKYTTLQAAREAIIPVCNAHGVAVLQPVRTIVSVELKAVFASVTTVLKHESGEELLLGPFDVPAQSPTAQHLVAASTYARRIALLSAFGLAGEEDLDGNEQHEPAPARPAARPPQPPQAARTPSPAPKTPAAAPAAPAATQAAPAKKGKSEGPPAFRKPEAEGEWVESAVPIVKVYVKDGERDGKPWRKFDVLYDVGEDKPRRATTFDTKLGALAQEYDGKVFVDLLLCPDRDPQYTKLLALRATPAPPPPEAEAEDAPEPEAPPDDEDIPFAWLVPFVLPLAATLLGSVLV